MTSVPLDPAMETTISKRAADMYHSDHRALYVRTDRLFGGLMIFQWLLSITLALIVSPRTWTGAMSQLHVHLWTAIILGGIISSFPLLLIAIRPGHVYTRHVVAIAQMLYSAILIHLTGGRIETHFHVFGSLAFLAFYRDWRVLITASIIVAADHFLRGILWPQSVFGVLAASQWRWLEHAAWVLFEDVFLLSQCRQGVTEMRAVARRHAELESVNRVIDAKVRERTRELADHREKLENTVKERTATLETTLVNLQELNTRLEQANTHRSHFLSTMSHELRTPLNAILGFADLLSGQGFGPLNEKQKNYVERIDKSGEHLLSLINDVLDVARIDVGAMVLKAEPLDPRGLVGGVIEMISTQLKSKQIRLVTEIAPDVGRVLADERKVKQILINLLTNAMKYSPSGEEIRVTCSMKDEDFVRFAIADRGVGISEGELESIFEEFHQADRARDEALGGIGLGLALCKRLVELHNGEIGVASTVGQGSEFWFTLPASAAKPNASNRTRVAKESDAHSETRQRCILVAEDNETNLAMLADMLSVLDHRIVIAHNGQECIELAELHHPDLILTDIRMPVLDGLEATRRLRAQPEFSTIPIIAISANASKASAEECLAAGCTLHLSKPVRSKQLYAALNRYLSNETVATDA